MSQFCHIKVTRIKKKKVKDSIRKGSSKVPNIYFYAPDSQRSLVKKQRWVHRYNSSWFGPISFYILYQGISIQESATYGPFSTGKLDFFNSKYQRTFTKQQLGTSNVRTKSPVEILQIITLGVPATFPVLEQAATKSSQTLTQLMACLAGIVRIKLQSGSVQTRRSRSKHPDTMRFGVVSKSETRKREILISIWTWQIPE